MGIEPEWCTLCMGLAFISAYGIWSCPLAGLFVSLDQMFTSSRIDLMAWYSWQDHFIGIRLDDPMTTKPAPT